MYCPAHFREERTEVLLELMAQHPLAAIVSSTDDGLVANHVPLMYRAADGEAGRLVGHVARSNPLWRAAPDREHLLIFQGPSAYISPNWYASKAASGKVVPTWNYAVVHVTATLTATQAPADMYGLLTELTDRHESAQPHPWRVDDAPRDFTERLMDSIVGVSFQIRRMEGKWKVSQNQPAENRRSVVDGLQAQGGQDGSSMATLVDVFGKR